jgi:ParB family chromosome partitioning protein
VNEKKNLGRGLSALIGGGNAMERLQAVGQSEDSLYLEIPISQIKGNPNQPRTIFDDDALAELAESIKTAGLVQPVIVRRDGESFELIAGERRWRAARIAGLEIIPAVIRNASDADSLAMALIENISREDLNPIDTARAYANLQEDFGITQESLASKLGRSRSAVANTMRLLDLTDEVQVLIESGKLSEGHGRALLTVGDRVRQRKLAVKMSERGLSVRQAEAMVKKEENKSSRKQLPVMVPVGQEVMDEATDALYSAFRLPVKVRWASKGGRIEIEFSEEEQLRNVIDTLEQSL